MSDVMIKQSGVQSVAPSRTGIKFKLGRVLVIQMLFISVVTALGVYAAALVVENVMIDTALRNEAKHYWQQRELYPDHDLPNTDNLRGYSLEAKGEGALPGFLRDAPLGRSRVSLDGREPIVYVEERGGRRLWLVFDEQSVRKLSFWFGVVPLSLALVVIYVSAWFVYRQSSKTLSPLMSLAQKMRDTELSAQGLDDLEYDDWLGPQIDDEVRVLADSLRDFSEQLRAMLIRERSFSRDVSHELRTPLAVIRGSLELLEKQGQLNQQQSRVVDRMQGTSRDMQSLIDILLELARSEHRGERGVEASDVNAAIDLLVTQVNLSHNADQHVNIEVSCLAKLETLAPSPVVAMVLGNLLRNACNYTTGGTVSVQTHVWGVRVSDTGAGMLSSELQRLQQPFQRQSEDNPGYGLGLDIVRRLCDRYGWVLHIRSSQGQGTQVDIKMHA